MKVIDTPIAARILLDLRGESDRRVIRELLSRYDAVRDMAMELEQTLSTIRNERGMLLAEVVGGLGK